MFTGIIEEMGKVAGLSVKEPSGEIKIAARKVLEGTKIGDSIAVNGVCLTVTKRGADFFCADIMAETFRRSSLKQLQNGNYVNLERAMAADGRFGGHIVSGHIDGVGEIVSQSKEGNAVWVKIKTPPEILRLLVLKGSICIDGISLTVAKLENDNFSVSIIPHTGGETTLLGKKPGELVNLENDVIGKYVERLLGGQLGTAVETTTKSESGITMDFLLEHGF